MVSRRHSRVIMLYEFKLSHTGAEAVHNIALAFGTGSLSEKTVNCWFVVSRRYFRVIMLYEFKLSHSAAEAARNIALAFGTDSPSERTVSCCFAKFSSLISKKPGRGRRMSLDDQALTMRAAVETKPDTTTRTLAAGLALHYSTVSKHLAPIGMVRKTPKWTPHDLTDDQQSTRYENSNLLVRQENEPFLDRLITIDENGSHLIIRNVVMYG
ncbi:hypothetical protein Y032_0020g174 [Ancylostoma ceylanicum]|uniref:Mos1 transposase HTH domain-containing protein n=1 Tax=Ancylostoma ceylanicum TaxID=53326 RepID=A0A016V0N5_9BILA|nr:hypothetical protein Y032_0020g174 [Ancylostoma ceylanicum]